MGWSSKYLAILLATFLGWWVHVTFWKGCKRDLQRLGIKRSLWITWYIFMILLLYYFNPIKYNNFPTNFLLADALLFLSPAESQLQHPAGGSRRQRDVHRKELPVRKGLGRSSVEKKGRATFLRFFGGLKTRWNEWGDMVDLVEYQYIYKYIYIIYMYRNILDHIFYPAPAYPLSPFWLVHILIYLVSLHRFFPVKNPPKKKLQTPKFQLTIDPPNQTLDIIDVGRTLLDNWLVVEPTHLKNISQIGFIFPK